MRPRGSASELEVRRRIAARMFRDGMRVVDIAEVIGVSTSSVKRWKTAWLEGGEEALAAKPHLGPRHRLSEDQKRRLLEILSRGARVAGYRTELWTCARIAEVIESTFGISYHQGHVWRILRSLGWTPQRPERRARERNEEAIDHWRMNDWPRIKKGLARAS